ncbi:uncharacterized protein N7498_006068 [Penicillium cinerascens]|uniref:Uncharacterized protein n=1 Tax=Penicillium cinerascens TaxID=70096 RepID=A0A9W9MHH8_9EURO|nr:uncharacterized protein N7498_006068 [Penicillium cinerascens]KAJ5201405.1 hypothetical protein N7498_006068 [Penicillium cinerascens]
MPKRNLSNIRLYGCLAYCRIQKLAQSDKIHPRAEVGFLVCVVTSNPIEAAVAIGTMLETTRRDDEDHDLAA